MKKLTADDLLRRYAKGERNFKNIDLSHEKLSNKNLNGIDLGNSNLKGVDFRGSNLSEALLDDTLLVGADLSNANLIGANLDGAILIRANLSNADLTNAHLVATRLNNAIARYTKFVNADLYVADLKNADLESADFSGADFHHADFRGANLNHAYIDNSVDNDYSEGAKFTYEGEGDGLIKTKKLEWHENTEGGWVDTGVDKAYVWEATYTGKEGRFNLIVFPMSLIDKNEEGWEYRIDEVIQPSGKVREQYDSAFDSTNKSYAPTAKVAMKWAEATLEDMLEKRRAKR